MFPMSDQERLEAKQTGRVFFNDHLFHAMKSVDQNTHEEDAAEIQQVLYIVQMIRAGLDIHSLSKDEITLLKKYYGPTYLKSIVDQMMEDRSLVSSRIGGEESP